MSIRLILIQNKENFMKIGICIGGYKNQQEEIMERFKKIYEQGMIDVVEIWVDIETGVNYVFHRNGNAAGFTPLLDKEGKPIITEQIL